MCTECLTELHHPCSRVCEEQQVTLAVDVGISRATTMARVRKVIDRPFSAIKRGNNRSRSSRRFR